MPRKRRNSEICGTQQGYEQHLQRSERPCSQCLVGSVTYTDIEVAHQIEDFQEKVRDRQLWGSYGILRITFEQIFDEQQRRCGCCKATDPKQGWHLDLDAYGALRGILCSDCNRGIEQLGDDLRGVQRAMTYLQGHLERGGHPPHYGPVNCVLKPPPSHRMEVCFKHFAAGMPVSSVVVLEKLPPDLVSDFYQDWLDRQSEGV